MWISSNIISQMVDIGDIKPEELALKLTMATAEIEAVEYVNKHLETIITAKILDVNKHPESDHLTLVTLDTGKEQTKVVCGAPNHKKDDIVPLALVGTAFSEDFVIKKSKIRGVESNGMLCSKKELGFSDDHSGIMIFPENTTLGVPLSELFPKWIDVRFEIDNKSITHRPDLWSHIGFAREIGAVLGRPVKDPVNYELAKSFKKTEELTVSVENSEACPRYSALMIKNIKVAESPEWLKAMVSSIGMRPISNIVDITNFVMAELGIPMHAFDTAKLNGNTIIVRMAKQGEPITTLDSKSHTLTNEDIVIADAKGPIGLAGVMGGENSEIEDSTSAIVLEAANFNPVNIRKTAARYNARTEAAMRFEKSLTPEATIGALLRCYELIKECCPESVAATEIVDFYPKKQETVMISISIDMIRRQLGEEISDSRILQILESLAFKVKNNNGELEIEVPKYRSTKDVTIPADIVEEVGRVYGYDNITSTPPLVPCLPPAANELRVFERKVKEILSRNEGLTEVSGYSFVNEDILKQLGIFEDKELRLKNPLSQEADRLVRSLVPNIVKNVQLNQRNFDDFAIYEMSRVYLKDDRKSSELINEERRLTGAVYRKKSEEPVFYEGKNIVASLLKQLRVKKVTLKPITEGLPAYAHPQRSMLAEIDGERAGLIFELHPKTIADFEIKGNAVIFDFSVNKLFEAKKEDIVFKELQRFPEVPFDISVLADEFEHASNIIEVIAKSSPKFIASVDVLDIYKGEQIAAGKKSVSFSIIFQATDHTLEGKEIENLQQKVIKDLAAKGYALR